MAKLSKRELIRIEAVKAAAKAFTNPSHDNIEKLWALSVFFEMYIRKGGDGTLKDFGPKEETATVVHLVRKAST